MRKIVVLLVALVAAGLIAGGSALAKKGSIKKLSVTMNGKQEVPKGSPAGSGTARISLDSAKGQICFGLTWSKIKDPVAAHIHKGAKGKAGPIVVPLFAKPPSKHSGCVAAKKTLVAAIAKKPTDYYVNIHTKDYPAGAIRGQL